VFLKFKIYAMKKITVLVSILIATVLTANAQCDKNIKWTSSKSEFLDTSGNVLNQRDEAVEVTTTPTKISIIRHDEQDHKMEGDITDLICKWQNKQNGKTTFKSALLDADENKTRHATITIEAVNGKTTILLRAEEEETMIRLNIDSSEEVK
jgi:hypothetical protein